jgi:ankyrin repeat protein
VGASAKGKNEVVEFLLDFGADINAKDQFGRNALGEALAIPDVADLVYGRPAPDYSASELIRLRNKMRSDQLELVTLLLDRGADVNARDNFLGSTPLTQAASEGLLEAVRLLLDRGANISAKGEEDRTALKIAQRKGHKEIVELLKARGAKE